MSTPTLEQIALIKVAGRCMDSLRQYAVECFPEITNGQKHFVRVLMESWADEIQEVLPPALTALRPAQPEPNQFPAQEGTASVPEEVRRAVEKAIDRVLSDHVMADGCYRNHSRGANMQHLLSQAIAPF